MSNGTRFGFAVEYVEDIEEARRFYEEVMGLDVQRHHPAFVQFEHFGIAADASLGGTGETELFWLVDNAGAAFAALPEGSEVTLPLRQEPFGTVFGVRGPSGRPCYLLELAQDRPSEPAKEGRQGAVERS